MCWGSPCPRRGLVATLEPWAMDTSASRVQHCCHIALRSPEPQTAPCTDNTAELLHCPPAAALLQRWLLTHRGHADVTTGTALAKLSEEPTLHATELVSASLLAPS